MSQRTGPVVWPSTWRPIGPVPWKSDLPNFGEVTRFAACRSGQPTAAGFSRLVTMGVRTILSLRAEGPDDREGLPSGIALDFLRLGWIDEAAPPGCAENALLEIVTDSARWPINLHCLAGAGRTGCACAVIRHALDGWEMEEARREILLYRPGVGPFRWPMAGAQKNFLREYAATHKPGWARGQLSMSLFQTGSFTLHSGSRSSFLVDCNSLTEADLRALARLAARHLPRFRDAIGVPEGGLRFAAALKEYATGEIGDPLLIADDILTTGASMIELREQHRGESGVMGIVLFARGPLPSWVQAVWQLGAVFR